MLDGFDDGLAVVVYAPELDGVAGAVGFEDGVGGLEFWGDGVADAAEVEEMDAGYASLFHGDVGVARYYEVGFAAREQFF